MFGSFSYYLFAGLYGIAMAWAVVKGLSDGLNAGRH